MLFILFCFHYTYLLWKYCILQSAINTMYVIRSTPLAFNRLVRQMQILSAHHAANSGTMNLWQCGCWVSQSRTMARWFHERQQLCEGLPQMTLWFHVGQHLSEGLPQRTLWFHGGQHHSEGLPQRTLWLNEKQCLPEGLPHLLPFLWYEHLLLILSTQ